MRTIITNSTGRYKSNHIIMTVKENGLNIAIKGQYDRLNTEARWNKYC